MKAIATSIEPKAVESGFHARSDRPVTGFDFEHLFAIVDASGPEEAAVADGDEFSLLPVDGQEMPIAGLAQSKVDRAQTGLGALGAHFIDAILSTPDVVEAFPAATAAKLRDAQKTPEGVSFAGLAAPQPITTESLVGKDLIAPFSPELSPQGEPGLEGAAALRALTDTPAPEGRIADLALNPEALEAGVEIPAPFVPPGEEPVLFAELTPEQGPDAAAHGTLPQVGEVLAAPISSRNDAVLPEDGSASLQPRSDGSLSALDRMPNPGAPPARIAAAEPTALEDAAGDAEFKVSTPAARDVRRDKLTVEPDAKHQPTAVSAPPAKVEAPLGPAPTLSQATRQDPVMPTGKTKLSKTVARDAELSEKTTNTLVTEIAMQAEAPRVDLAKKAPERAEPFSVAPAAARSPVVTPPASSVLPTALPSTAVLNLRQADWGKQLVSHIERMAASGSQRIELSLRPKNLGEIQVLIDLRGDQTLVHIVTETAAAARLLGGAEDRLAQVLDQSGYRLSGFSAQEQGTGAQGGQQGQQGQQGQPSPRRNRTAVDANKHEDTSEATATGPYSAGRGQTTGINVLA